MIDKTKTPPRVFQQISYRIFWNSLSGLTGRSGSAKKALCYHARCAVREKYQKLRSVGALATFPYITENINGRIAARLKQCVDEFAKRLLREQCASIRETVKCVEAELSA